MREDPGPHNDAHAEGQAKHTHSLGSFCSSTPRMPIALELT